MTDDENYHCYTKRDLPSSNNMAEVSDLSAKVREILARPSVKESIATVHQLGASSIKVQSSLLAHMISLGFQSEKKGLFADFNVAGIRPDYYKNVVGGGVIFEVERGKTIANNMDLLDVWKTHICQEAKHLFLLVPVIRVTEKGGEQKVFKFVEKRIGAFFSPHVEPIDVDSVHLFGY